MLKNIPAVLSPELLKILMEMGHGDELVIGDGNFPAASNARHKVGMRINKFHHFANSSTASAACSSALQRIF